MAVPQFGDREPGLDYPDRPAAFVVIVRDALIALVRVEEPGVAPYFDLPGGGLDPGETSQEAAIRECGEEAGLRVDLDPEPFLLADHYALPHRGGPRNTRGAFYVGRVVAQDVSLQIEPDHTLDWRDPAEAIAILDRDAHAWAVAAWLRLKP
jgi:8-oxo-dGTP diphosphatase